MSLVTPPGLYFNDPDHVLFKVAWMRGITPLRLAVMLVICAMFAARPTLWNFDPEDPFGRLRALVTWSIRYFPCALPLFVLAPTES